LDIHWSRGESVIDYVLMNEEIKEEVSLEIGEQVDSDHHPIVVRLNEKEGGNREKRERERRRNGGI